MANLARKASKRVLIVDDDEDCRILLSVKLSWAGYAVETAEGFESARTMLAQEQIDILVTDLHMPKQGGIALLSYVRGYHREMPVVVLTADHNFSPSEAIDCGATNVLYKPVDWEKMWCCLRDFTATG